MGGYQEKGILDAARNFSANELKPLARKIDAEGRFPRHLIEPMAGMGFFGMNYPVEFGGLGIDSVTCCRVAREIARASAGVALTLHVQWMAMDALLRFGSEEQKQKHLVAMANGEKIAAYTISETQAGSDAAAITATAEKTAGGWKINGAKYFCTNGGLADIYLIAAKTDPAAGAKGIGMFIVEKGTPGFTVGAPEEKMGCRASETTSLQFRDCEIPFGNMLGRPGEGFKIAMFGLVGGRLGMACMGLGIAEAALESAAGYAVGRTAFGKPLISLYAVQAMLAEMHVKVEAATLMVDAVAARRDAGEDYSLDTSVAKLFVAEVAGEVCHKALQIFGGHGYMKHNDVERYARDARLLDIGVGASEVLKMVVGTAVPRIKGMNST